jgi:hypothetical protein
VFSQQPLIGIIIIKPDAVTERRQVNQPAVARIHKLPLALLAVGWCLFLGCYDVNMKKIFFSHSHTVLLLHLDIIKDFFIYQLMHK